MRIPLHSLRLQVMRIVQIDRLQIYLQIVLHSADYWEFDRVFPNESPVLNADQQEDSSNYLPKIAAAVSVGVVLFNAIKSYQRIDTQKVAWYKRPFIALGKGIINTIKLPWHALQCVDRRITQFIENMD